MTQFSVKSGPVKGHTEEVKNLMKELNRLEESIRVVNYNLGFNVSAKRNIRARLNNSAELVNSCSEGMQGMSSALWNIISSYEKTEQKIIDNSKICDTEIKDSSISSYNDADSLAKDIINKYINPLLEEIDDGVYRDYILSRLESIEDYIAKLYNGEISAAMLLSVPELIKGDKEAFDNFVDDIKGKIVDVTAFDIDKRVDGAYYDKEVSCENGSLGVTISAYEAYVGADGGVFTLDDDGNLVFNPHVNAEIGASYTVLSAHGDYAIGDDMLGAAVSGSVIVGQVSGKAEIAAGLMDEKGNFDPHASLNASAEAILIDAKAQAGATVLGTEAKVEAGVNIGVGAHADISIGDGKLEFDIGASLGIGVSLSAEIDFGGTIDAIQEGCKSFWDKVTPW